MTVADVLLRNAPQAAGMPWQILSHVPVRVHKPSGLRLPTRWIIHEVPPEYSILAANALGSGSAGLFPALVAAGCAANWESRCPSGKSAGQPIKEIITTEMMSFQGLQSISQMLETEANLETIRAWLALEHGRTDRARAHIAKVLDKVVLGRTSDGISILLKFRGEQLATYCFYLITPNRR
jgi:hypothetical protein